MLKWSYKIAEVQGIPIKLHITLLLILPFLNRDFGFFPAIALSVGIFATIALHELGHSLVAIRKGCRVREILLLPIGGIAQIENIPTRAAHEFQMAIAGPSVSLALFLLLFFGGAFLPLKPVVQIAEAEQHARLNIVQLLGVLNLGFTIFNLIPAFPMDGGRILRAWLAPRLGRLRATYYAASIGKITAVLFGFLGITKGLWTLVAIAIFIYFAAGHEYRAVQLQETARRFGWGFWPPAYREPDEGFDSGTDVEIGPPPYENGPGSRTTIRTFRERRDDFFRKMFE